MTTDQSQSSPIRSSSPVDAPQDDDPSEPYSENESVLPSQEKDADNPETRSKVTKEQSEYYLQRRQRPDSSHPPLGVSLAEDRTNVPKKKGGTEGKTTPKRSYAFYGDPEETPPHGIKVLVTSGDGTLVAFQDDPEDQAFVLIEAMSKMKLGQ